MLTDVPGICVDVVYVLGIVVVSVQVLSEVVTYGIVVVHVDSEVDEVVMYCGIVEQITVDVVIV